MEGGLSKIQKIDRARRNTLKAASLVFGAVVATGALHKLASAAPGGNGNGNGNGGNNGNNGNGNGVWRRQQTNGAAAIALRGARKSGRARAIGRSKPWQRATRSRCVLGASRRSRQWSVSP